MSTPDQVESSTPESTDSGWKRMAVTWRGNKGARTNGAQWREHRKADPKNTVLFKPNTKYSEHGDVYIRLSDLSIYFTHTYHKV